jgi:hypothetical protein
MQKTKLSRAFDSVAIWVGVWNLAALAILTLTGSAIAAFAVGSFVASVNQYRRRTPEPFKLLRRRAA